MRTQPMRSIERKRAEEVFGSADFRPAFIFMVRRLTVHSRDTALPGICMCLERHETPLHRNASLARQNSMMVVHSRPRAHYALLCHPRLPPTTVIPKLNKSELERQRQSVRDKRFHQNTFVAALLILNSVGRFMSSVAHRLKASLNPKPNSCG